MKRQEEQNADVIHADNNEAEGRPADCGSNCWGALTGETTDRPDATAKARSAFAPAPNLDSACMPFPSF